MDSLRTPDERFDDLPGWGYDPQYVEVDGVRIHVADVGPRDAAPVLLLHGEPSWGYLYRKMIAPIAAAGHRVIAPDLVGFGRSDKPTRREDYTYARHNAWVRGVLDALELRDITLFCQDWGGLIGLRLLAEDPDRFARVIAANTFLPTGREPTGQAFLKWREHTQTVERVEIGRVIQRGTTTELDAETLRAYEAPFPDERYKAGARIFPVLVPIRPDDPEGVNNGQAWQRLMTLQTPFLTAFGDSDPITRGADAILQRLIPGAKGQPHTTIEGAGHFLQEDRGEQLAEVVLSFIAST